MRAVRRDNNQRNGNKNTEARKINVALASTALSAVDSEVRGSLDGTVGWLIARDITVVGHPLYGGSIQQGSEGL